MWLIYAGQTDVAWKSQLCLALAKEKGKLISDMLHVDGTPQS